ncbi:hypothetical protein [Endozoicomonas acroporae]|uniref:hypothetical protein n=1 Tax=Endozoicomonas acroporae TaxID=1701104 RepID=UPI003D79B613
MPKISSAVKIPRVPESVEGIQVNCCQNPICENFQIPPSIPDPEKVRRNTDDQYRVSGSAESKVLACKLCGNTNSLKSNLATWEEYRRISHDIDRAGYTFCSRVGCVNQHYAFQTHPRHYHRNGQSPEGRLRLKCKLCRKNVTVSDHRRKKSRKRDFKDLGIFRMLMHQAHLRGIAGITDTDCRGVYRAIDRIFEKCQLFTAQRERKLSKAIKGRALNVAFDQQLYSVNWACREDRRLTVLPAASSVDNISRYCFGMHLSFDGTIDSEALEAAAEECGDPSKPQWARTYARYWFRCDHRETMKGDQKLPDVGAQIHNAYTLIAHFLYLRDLFKEAKFIQFSLDREPGITRAFLNAFGKRVTEGDCCGFLVRIEKGLGNDTRRGLVGTGAKLLYELAGNQGPFDKEEENAIKADYLQTLFSEESPDVWVESPFHTITQPYKASQLIKGPKLPSMKRLAYLHLYSSLHAIDSLFNATRRSISYLERPLSKESSAGRVWSGKNPYNPIMIEKVLTIHRTYYNFIKVGNDGKTPAMRIGVANAPLKVEDVMYFDPYS